MYIVFSNFKITINNISISRSFYLFDDSQSLFLFIVWKSLCVVKVQRSRVGLFDDLFIRWFFLLQFLAIEYTVVEGPFCHSLLKSDWMYICRSLKRSILKLFRITRCHFTFNIYTRLHLTVHTSISLILNSIFRIYLRVLLHIAVRLERVLLSKSDNCLIIFYFFYISLFWVIEKKKFLWDLIVKSVTSSYKSWKAAFFKSMGETAFSKSSFSIKNCYSEKQLLDLPNSFHLLLCKKLRLLLTAKTTPNSTLVIRSIKDPLFTWLAIQILDKDDYQYIHVINCHQFSLFQFQIQILDFHHTLHFLLSSLCKAILCLCVCLCALYIQHIFMYVCDMFVMLIMVESIITIFFIS